MTAGYSYVCLKLKVTLQISTTV